MRARICSLVLCITIVSVELAIPQATNSRMKSISFQPVFWLDNLVPTEFTALALQFEAPISLSQAFAARAVWFGDPVFGPVFNGAHGYALSLEYRHYFSENASGWHAGPFAEWVIYNYFGRLRDTNGSTAKNLWDFGITGGHKWQSGKLVFDLSVRTSWYSPYSYPKGGYFPRLPNSSLNSMLILTTGYSLD